MLFIFSLFGCNKIIKEYDKTPLNKLTFIRVDYNGGATSEYLFDFEKNIATKRNYIPGDEENDSISTIAEFTEEQEKR